MIGSLRCSGHNRLQARYLVPWTANCGSQMRSYAGLIPCRSCSPAAPVTPSADCYLLTSFRAARGCGLVGTSVIASLAETYQVNNIPRKAPQQARPPSVHASSPSKRALASGSLSFGRGKTQLNTRSTPSPIGPVICLARSMEATATGCPDM
jgi:hypothetical protein